MTSACLSSRAGATGASALASVDSVSLLRMGVWRGDDWEPSAVASQVQASGIGLLDAVLPGGGWPVGAMSEMLLPPHAHAEWQLISGALAHTLHTQSARRAVLVNPPYGVFAPFLQVAGIAPQQLCCVDATNALAQKCSSPDARAVWVGEQALRCRDVCAVLVWLPQSHAQALRRLQLLAAQQRQLLWVFRPENARAQTSPAPLRLWLQPEERRLRIHVLKRRGPSLEAPIDLPLLHGQLRAELMAQAGRRAQAQIDAGEMLQARKDKEAANALAGMALALRR